MPACVCAARGGVTLPPAPRAVRPAGRTAGADSACRSAGSRRYTLGFVKASKIPLFKAEHPLELILNMEAYEFKATSVEHLSVYLSYGLDAAVPYEFASSSQILPDAYERNPEGNQARYDGGFDFGPATQLALVAHCEAVHAVGGAAR